MFVWNKWLMILGNVACISIMGYIIYNTASSLFMVSFVCDWPQSCMVMRI